MKTVSKWILAVAVVAMLAGCNTRLGMALRGATDDANAPAPLVDFDASLRVEQLWQRNLGQGEGRLGMAITPTLAEGRVYAADPGGALFAIDASSGQDIWRVDTGIDLSAGPGVGSGVVVAVSLDGDVVAYGAEDGRERWRQRASSEVLGTPAVSSGLVVVRSIDGRVIALDATSGAQRWMFERSTPALSLRSKSRPLVAQGAAFIGYEDGVVVALRLQDGVRVWEQRVSEPEGRGEIERLADIAGDMQISGNELYVASFGGQVMALALASGQPLWTYDLRSHAGLGLSGRFLLATDSRSTVWALDRNTSSALWRQEGMLNRWLGTPVVHAEHVLVADGEGYLHWLDLQSGAPAARTRHGRDAIRGTPQVSADSIAYVLDTNGRLAAYRVSRL